MVTNCPPKTYIKHMGVDAIYSYICCVPVMNTWYRELLTKYFAYKKDGGINIPIAISNEITEFCDTYFEYLTEQRSFIVKQMKKDYKFMG